MTRVLLALCLLALPVACRSSSGPATSEQLEPLTLGRWSEGVLHCDRGRCEAWHELIVTRSVRVVIEADAPADPLLPDFALDLRNRNQQKLADDVERLRRPRRIVRTLQPGTYYVRIFGLEGNGEPLGYKLIARPAKRRKRRPATHGRPSQMRPPARSLSAPKPPQQPFVTEVLEVERSGGEPVAVLVAAGTAEAMRPGLAGTLVDGGRVIGRIEVVDVYAAGSRARIVGGLSAPITLETQVQIAR